MVRMKMIEFRLHFYWTVCSFGPLSRALLDYHLEGGGIPLYDAVRVNYKKCATTENQGGGA